MKHIEEPTVFGVPCDKVFVVAPEKTKEFKNIKANPELLNKIKDAAKKLNITIELEPVENVIENVQIKKLINKD